MEVTMFNLRRLHIKGIIALVCTLSLMSTTMQQPTFAEEWKDKSDLIFNSSSQVDQDLLIQFQIVRTGKSSQTKDVEFKRSDMGVVDVLYNAGANKKIKVIIDQSGTKYTYTIGKDINYVKFPLQLGNGKYSITIYENVSGNKYKKIFSKQDSVEVFTPNAVYLNSIQIVDWKINDSVIAFMNQLVLDEKKAIYMRENNVTTITDEKYLEVHLTKKQITDIAYNYVVANISYDYAKISTLPPNYIPSIEATLRDQKGICYDYSSLLASMLRSQGIPAKLIKGYSSTTDVYHAWNEIYLTDEKRWIIVDTTYDAYMHKAGAQYAMEKKLINYSKNFEY